MISIDLGGTTVRGALVAFDGTLLQSIKQPHQAGNAPSQVLAIMRQLAAEGTARQAVVGLPGRVDRSTGTLEFATQNLPGTDFSGLSASRLTTETGLVVELANDAELAVLGEAAFGAGSRHGTTAYLTFSTGVGAAAAAGGRILAGSMTGYQIGQFPVLGTARPILNELSSAWRIRLLDEETGTRASDIQTVIERADSGEPAAVRTWADVVDGAAAAALLMCLTCSPDVLVIGGGIARGGGERLLAAVRERVDRDAGARLGLRTEVRAAALGDDAGLTGGAAWYEARTAMGART
ncbi:ROK family protein [Rhizohabitans arisaemae]|uniref:ROK family protein n=1 Tax=Rhizohabitans arisaemae TaxID=2720610 RepID=UPI0024B13274|nr:ROK family protein [Rhizohabitans arisaemae]